MMETTKSDSIEWTGKTVEEATAEALEKLGVTEDQVIVTVLDEGSKGFLGLGGRFPRVRVEMKPDFADVIKAFLREVTLAMGLDINIEATQRERHLYVNLTGDNMGILIGKHGATLDALQYITNLTVGRNNESSTGVVIDTENYRRRRRDTLEGLARRKARDVKTSRKPVKLEPMSRYERHIIHTILQHDKQVKTYSEGNEPYRYVVVAPK